MAHRIDKTESDSPAHGFDVRRCKNPSSEPGLEAAWSEWLQRGDPLDAVHRSRAYFEHLVEMGKRPEFVLVRDRDRLAGLVPVRPSSFKLQFRPSTTRTLAQFRFRGLILVGSEPMAEESTPLLDAFFRFVSKEYGDIDVIDIYSAREDGFFWKYLATSPALRREWGVHVLGGFRDSYSVTLPKSVDQYYAKLSKKRRYNLKRQERLLEQHLGASLELAIIEQETDIERFFDALRALGGAKLREGAFSEEQYRSAARRGLFRAYLLSGGSETVGVVAGFKSEHAYFVNDILFQKSLAKFSPGTTLWQVVIRSVIEAGEFGRIGLNYGAPVYRFEEVNQIERRGRVLLFRRTLRNRLLFSAHAAFEAATKIAKQRLGAALGKKRPHPSRADEPRQAER